MVTTLMRAMCRTVVTFAALAVCVPVQAGTAAGGKVTSLIPANTSYSFVTNGTRVSVPSCATGAPNNWVIDMSTPSGQGIAASIITAFSLGKSMDIQGTGTCPAVQPNVEAVQFVAVFP